MFLTHVLPIFVSVGHLHDMMKRTLLLLAGAVLLCALPLRAQDGSHFLQSLAERLHRTPKAYDTSYVRKLDLPWTASVSTDLFLAHLQTSVSDMM